MTKLAEDIRVVDVDAHMTEPHDLWSKRAPKGYEDRVPRVAEVDGAPTWILDGKPFAWAGGGGTIDREGNKHPYYKSHKTFLIDDVSVATYDPIARLAVMDEHGIDTQVIYPNRIGVGGKSLVTGTGDPTLRRLCVELYNDAMAEMQDLSGNRLLPMPILPVWDVEGSVREAERVAALGLRGVNMSAFPQDAGSPDLANRAWDPLWDLCADLRMPIHFHVGASLSETTFYGPHCCPSIDDAVKPAIGGMMHFLNNAGQVINTIFSGMFDRHPNLKMVSVESGIGWIPFVLEAMDYELWENAPEQAAELAHMPSEYFKTNWLATVWFEKGHGNLQGIIDVVGEDNVMFETDYPHPTCLYPGPLDKVHDAIVTLRPTVRRKVMSDNARRLYRL